MIWMKEYLLFQYLKYFQRMYVKDNKNIITRKIAQISIE